MGFRVGDIESVCFAKIGCDGGEVGYSTEETMWCRSCFYRFLQRSGGPLFDFPLIEIKHGVDGRKIVGLAGTPIRFLLKRLP